MEESLAYGIFAKIFSSSMSTHHLSEQEVIRRQKLAELNKLIPVFIAYIAFGKGKIEVVAEPI